MKGVGTKKGLSPEQREELLETLKVRFEKNMNRHKGLEWAKVQSRICGTEANAEKLWSLGEMERTGGEPDVVGHDKKTGEYVFFDCSAESPKGRTSVCYDREGLESRKENRPKTTAMDMAAAMGIEILTEDQYLELQKLGDFDAKTSTYDSAIVADSDWSDIDLAAIGDYRQLRRDAHTDAEELGWSDEELLRALGCVKREDGHLKPTVAGILLFGTNKALRRCFPMMRIDYIRVPGRHWVENPDHRFNTLEIRAPLFSAIRKATSAIHDELIQSFTLAEGSLAREDEPALPLRVIREAVVNAVMHRSYRIHGTVQIIRYANRLEIRNPGHSIKAEEQLGEPGSETRNPRIAAVLHEVNIAETKGSGIRAMRELMIAQGLLPPTFESSRRPDQFVGTFLFHHFLGPDDLAWLGRLTAEPLSDEEARALVFVREVGAIDNAAYRAINRTDTLNASVHLRHLRDLDLLAMKGAGNRAYYVPGKHFQPNLAANAQDSHQPGPDSHQPIPDSHHPLATISEDLRRRIPPAGSKPRRAVLRELIIDLCRWRPLSARELATILNGREPKPLVRDYLTPLVAEGLLVYTIPEMENHPEQRYVAGPTTEVSPDE